MRTYGHNGRPAFPCAFRILRYILPCAAIVLALVPAVIAQTPAQGDLSQQVRQLNDAMAQVQYSIQASQQQLDELRHQLDVLQARLAATQSAAIAPPTPKPATSSDVDAASIAAEIQGIKEVQAVQQSEIATHDQIKVESESRYPVRITGLLLLNGFVNTGAVDVPATPTVATPGPGSTGASLRQTILGLDARGPHLFGARSYADLRVDFDGTSQYTGTAAYSGYSVGLLRLRTAHAGLQWDHTDAYFSLDRPLFNPDSPSSLAAVAQPALAWSGNLWTWNPQVGLTHDLPFGDSHALRLQAALIDVADAPLTPVVSSELFTPPSAAERSRWPGVEARAALLGDASDANRNHLGVGGYFSEHLTSFGSKYDSWATTADTRLRLPARFQLTASAYRGLGLGGLGGGGYKDFAYRTDSDGNYYIRPLQDVGGWAELKERFSERLELNAAFGIDNVFANDLRRYATPGSSDYINLARNRTYTGNIIYSPSASLLFSLEYRHLDSSPVLAPSASTNVIDMAAGYKF
jgi:uncharacterized coiled-coil protein SlyX